MDQPSSRNTANMAGRRTDGGTEGKVFPPDSPVDVPNLPQPPHDDASDAAHEAAQPVADRKTDSSWADNTQPAPDKKNVRTSNIF
ncbi:hypothetical protein [Bordetella flabilis]|nr:hypothetical protein [Bordetella flabilis]